MKVLLDECVTQDLKSDFIGHEVFTVEDAGLKGLKNGQLLSAASGKYEVLVTVDQNFRYQQNLASLSLAIIVLRAPRSSYSMLKPLMPKVLSALRSIRPGEMIVVS